MYFAVSKYELLHKSYPLIIIKSVPIRVPLSIPYVSWLCIHLQKGRIQELEQLNEEHKVALRTIEQLKMDLQYLPEHVVRETTEYKCLQSQFSVLYNESMQLQTQLEEYRQQLQGARLSHQRTIERMESEELAMQKKLRTEVIRLEDALAQV